MTKENTCNNPLINLLKNDAFKSILVEGKWGVGKTYLWKEYEKEENNTIHISLMGITSTQSFKEAIVTQTTINEDTKKFASGLKKIWQKRLRKAI